MIKMQMNYLLDSYRKELIKDLFKITMILEIWSWKIVWLGLLTPNKIYKTILDCNSFLYIVFISTILIELKNLCYSSVVHFIIKKYRLKLLLLLIGFCILGNLIILILSLALRWLKKFIFLLLMNSFCQFKKYKRKCLISKLLKDNSNSSLSLILVTILRGLTMFLERKILLILNKNDHFYFYIISNFYSSLCEIIF